jgi:ribosomal protein S18 acetylase RimI-like enzyme
MTEMPGTITLYSPEMAEAVALMFNDFNELWPGGFGGGIPYDADRVHDFLDQTSAVADLIALDEHGKPVGYCGLYPHWREEDAAFITIIGVVPRVKGHKFGRRLLLHAFDLAGERGFRRVDLGTWAGNLDAVPLYKKTGLYWVPETNVYMQNFLPGLRQIPLAQAWFAKHPDWYACYQRELAQAPDDELVDGMAVYTYRFQSGEDTLLGRVDRYGWGICEVESQLDGRRIGLKTRLEAHNILVGISNALTIIVDNGTSEELTAALSVEAFKGLHWQAPFPLTVVVPAGQTRAIRQNFLIDQSAQTYRSLEPSALIRTRMILNGQVVELATGGKIQPAVELINHQGYQMIHAGSPARVYLDIKNNANQVLHGDVAWFVEGQAAAMQAVPFELTPKELSGLALCLPPADGPDQAVTTLHASPSVETEAGKMEMPVFRFPLVPDQPELTAAIFENDRRRMRLLTDLVDVQVELEGGNISFGSRDLPGLRRPAHFHPGPPYGMGPDSTLLFTHTFEANHGSALLFLSAESRQFPGLRIQKYLRTAPGRKEIEHWVVLTNINSRSDLAIGGRMSTSGNDGISINAFGAAARSFTPLDGRVVVCDAQLPLMNDNMLPQDPNRWPESWSAVESLAHGDLAAWFWQPSDLEKIKMRNGMLSSLEAASRLLKPGASRTIFHLWYGFGFNSVEEVRLRWNQWVGKKEFSRHEYIRVEATHPVQARWVEQPVLERGQKNLGALALDFISLYPLRGSLRLALPDGWEGVFLPESGAQADAIPMPDPSPGEPTSIQVALTVPAQELRSHAAPRLHLSGEFEMDFPLPVLLASSKKVEINEQELEGRPVYTVDNGVLQFRVMADLGGGMIRLRDAQGRTYLDDNFPHIKPHLFLPHHVGGLQPLLFTPDAGQAFTELETVQAEAVHAGLWQGVRVAWNCQHQTELFGQDFSITYLTLPGSEIIRIRFSHHNASPRRVEWVGAFFTNLAFGGSREGITIQAPGGTQVWQRNQVPKPFVSLAHLRQPWAHFAKEGQSLLLAGAPKSNSTVTAVDFNQVIGSLMVALHQTDPHNEGSVDFLLAINQPAEQAMALIEAAQA